MPELGTITATRRPFVLLTSNATRELSEALKRRCLYLHLDYPDAERETAIVLARVPELDERLAEQLVRTVRALRAWTCASRRRSPSHRLGPHAARAERRRLDEAAVRDTLGVVLKHRSDQEKAIKELKL